MTIIKDPDGKAARVDGDGRLAVFADQETFEKHRNREAEAFSVHFTVTPVGANDFFYYLRNDGTKDIFIHKIRVASTVATELTYEFVSGTPVFITGAGAGSDPAVTAKNLGSPNTLTSLNKFDTDITGLTSEGIIYFEKIDVINKRFTLESSSNIIIPQGQAIAFKRVAATGAIDCVVSLVVDSGVVGV